MAVKRGRAPLGPFARERHLRAPLPPAVSLTSRPPRLHFDLKSSSTATISDMPHPNSALENAFGTIGALSSLCPPALPRSCSADMSTTGAVCWSLQLIPQIVRPSFASAIAASDDAVTLADEALTLVHPSDQDMATQGYRGTIHQHDVSYLTP